MEEKVYGWVGYGFGQFFDLNGNTVTPEELLKAYDRLIEENKLLSEFKERVVCQDCGSNNCNPDRL